MEVFESIVLGAVQGLTEFLPVSSSGHLQLAKELMGVELEENLTFDVMLHAATVLSTIVVLWSEIWRLVRGVFSRGMNPQKSYFLKLVVSMIPVGIVGFLLRDKMDALLASPHTAWAADDAVQVLINGVAANIQEFLLSLSR